MNDVRILMALPDRQAWALAQLVKRIGWTEMRQNAVDDDEAREMRDALACLGNALAESGYAPR